MLTSRPFETVSTRAWQSEAAGADRLRAIPEERAVALSYNGSTHAVMMATPLDLEDFALGFSLTEAQVSSPGQIRSVEIAEFEEGIDLRIWLAEEAAVGFRDRRRRIAGPTGCGLCGVESLAEANPALPRVNGHDRYVPAQIFAAQAALFDAQVLHAETSAVHAAGFWTPEDGLVCVREDVGRHNALDKLVGAMAGAGRSGAGGTLLLTSRISVEMVQKAAVLGAPVIIAVSAPTALAVRKADEAGITLVALARRGGFEVFTHGVRVAL